jgi:hypothetical protein
MATLQTPRPPAPPASHLPQDSAATRHLCVGAYLDETFQRASLREAYYQPTRVVAPSYGFRLAPVLWHCLRARQAAIVRDSLIVAILLLSFCTPGGGPLLIAGALLQIYVVVALARLVRDTVNDVREGASINIGAVIVRAVKLLVGLFVLSMMWAFFWIVVVAASIGDALSDFGSDDGSSTGDLLAVTTAITMLFTLLIISAPVVTNLWRQYQIEKLVPGTRAGDPPSSMRFADIDKQQTNSNTVVYSGYRPFVGSGEVIDTWGFAQRLIRTPNGAAMLTGGAELEAERELDELPFSTQEIIQHVGDQMQALVANPGHAPDPNPEQHFPGLTVTDCVVLAGTEVSYLSTFTDQKSMAQMIRYPTTPARHYLACRVVSWDGELVTTVYVHFALEGRSLYLELTTTALPPCDERYRVVDHLGGTGAVAYLRALGRGIAEAPRVVALAPINLVRAIVDPLAARRFSSEGAAGRANRRAAVTRGYDYGAQVGVRELGAAPITRNHVQTQDVYKFKRIIERRVLASVLDFLESRGIDTTEYRQRALTVLNAGAVNLGNGSMTVQSAIGQQNQPPSPLRASR